MNKSKGYSDILKGTTLFGGVQVFQIIIQIAKSKVMAVLLGPVGFGLVGLLNTTISLITNLTNFGIGTSAVKEISQAYVSDDKEDFYKTVGIIRRVVWVTGIFGALLLLIFAEPIGKLTFGNSDFNTGLRLLSITLLVNQLLVGNKAIFQGSRKLSYLALSTLLGSFLGLCVSVPLYYWYGLDGVVPSMILSSIVGYFVTIPFFKKLKIKRVRLDSNELIKNSKPLLQLGMAISVSGILNMVVAYGIRIYMRSDGGLDDVGLFTAGFTIVNSYVGLVFSAMSTDYFPRLSAANNDKSQMILLVNQQAEITSIMLTPILGGLILFVHFGISILYSSDFLSVTNMVVWAALGTMLKGVSWALAYVFLATGESKAFFWNELVYNIYFFVSSLLGYYFFGLSGLGLAILVTYIIYGIQVYIIIRRKIDFSFSNSFIRMLLIQLSLVTGIVLVHFLISDWTKYIFGGIIFLVSIIMSYNELNKRLDITNLIKKKIL